MGITTCLFDLDGVLTQTAKIHAQAWKEMFDAFLRDWAERTGTPFQEFDRPTDYDEYVDGKPRLEGVCSFLDSRGIHLEMGSPTDPPEAETVHALGTRKNELVLELIRQQGVEPYEGSVRFAEAARDRSLRRAVVSSSTNCEEVLIAAGIDHLFEERIDGVVAERERLAGKPAPDTFLVVVAGFGGMRDHGGTLAFAPSLPARLSRLTFRLVYRGRRLRVDIQHDSARYELLDGEPLELLHHGQRLALSSESPETRSCPVRPRIARCEPPLGRRPPRRHREA